MLIGSRCCLGCKSIEFNTSMVDFLHRVNLTWYTLLNSCLVKFSNTAQFSACCRPAQLKEGRTCELSSKEKCSKRQVRALCGLTKVF